MCTARADVVCLFRQDRKETSMHHTTTEYGGAIHVRLQGSLFEQLEDWRRVQNKIPARSDAIRELLQRALDTEQPSANSWSPTSTMSQNKTARA
jgi:metal-responsive CopG/Arc/MetJ family transcriptional regulator